jgi:hypothetical protein
VSTPNGSNNFFAKLRKAGQTKVCTVHWSKHPKKDAEWYKAQQANRTDKDIAQELDINYTISAGNPFYTGFNRGLHLRKMNISALKPLVLSFDYGFNHPNCSVHQLSAEGIWIIVDNIFGTEQTIEEFGEYVLAYMNENYSNYDFKNRAFGDPAGKQASDKSRMSSEQILRKIGFKVQSYASNGPLTNYAARKAIIERKLRTLINGVPALVVNDVPNNMIIVEGFEGGYRSPDPNKYGGVSEVPAADDYYEHCMNTVEYFATAIFRPIEKKETLPLTMRPSHILPKDLQSKRQQLVNAGIGF